MFCLTLSRKFIVSDKLEVNDKMEDSATMFAAVAWTHRSLINIDDEATYKEVNRQVWRDV